MKKMLCIAVMTIVAQLTFAETIGFPAMEYTQDPKANYRLYKTENLYNFIKLDTRTGQMELVQWSVNDDNRITYTLSKEKLVSSPEDEIPGRFTLYATSNMYNFVLLDQIDGHSWQVHWGTYANQRWIQQSQYVSEQVVDTILQEPIKPKLAETTMMYSLDLTPVNEDLKLQVTLKMAEVQQSYRDHMLIKSPINQAYMTVIKKLMLSNYLADWAYVDQLTDFMTYLLEENCSVNKTELEEALKNQTNFIEITRIFKRFQ